MNRALFALLLVLLVAACGSGAAHTLSASKLDQQIAKAYSTRGYPGAVVKCPSGEKIKAQAVFLCPLSGVPLYKYVQVTILNAAGDIDYQAIQ